jgi:hypothetical protein
MKSSGIEEEGHMTEYQFHSWPVGTKGQLTRGVTLDAKSQRHGAALALRLFVRLGCDISAAGAHVDMTERDASSTRYSSRRFLIGSRTLNRRLSLTANISRLYF